MAASKHPPARPDGPPESRGGPPPLREGGIAVPLDEREAAAGPRVASLLPSTTEMVCALGHAAGLVGVSHECDFPPEIVGRPILTSAKGALARPVPQQGAVALPRSPEGAVALPRSPEGSVALPRSPEGAVALPRSQEGAIARLVASQETPARAIPSSGAIDRSVRDLLRDALAVYDIDVAALERVRPDVILTQDLCDVCAVSFDDVVCAVRALSNPDVRIVNLHPTRLADVWNDILTVGAAIGRERAAEQLVVRARARVEAVRVRAARAATRPNVLTIEWIDPVMIGGTWMPELVELAGGRALAARAGDHAPTLDREALRALDPAPDVVVVKPCGFEIERTLLERDVLCDLFAEVDWPAVQSGRVWIADGNAYFNRPGPRIADSLEILAACVHPELFADMAAVHAGAFVRFEEAARCT